MQFRSEESLIRLLKAGDDRAVEAWYQQSKDKLLTFFLTKVAQPHDAEELVHDTFVSCLSALPLFRAESGLWSWMLSIARHELADFWRKYYAKKVIRALPFGEELIESVGEVQEKFKVSGSRSKEVQEILNSMPEGMSELLQSKYIDGVTVKELAKRFGTSVLAMQSRLYRAKEVFAREYGKVESRD